MPENADNPLSFFQELKRRKVIRVIIVYAATSFVILELASIIQEPFRLPDWTIRLVFIVLVIGLILSIILSWIYDITPEGIEKTKPVHEVTKEDKPANSKSWKIASYISFVIIAGLVILNVVPRSTGTEKEIILEKSIAVIPFIDDSPNKDNEHIINGIMDDLLINLQSIKELRVPGRTSTEQYRNNPKPIPEIASELGVNYIVEGSGQKYGNHYTLRVQLIEGATGMHIWGDKFEQDIESVEDIVNFISEISSSIAEELETIISPEEKQLIERVPTTSLTALEFYQKAVEEHRKHWLKWNDMEAVERAEDLYHLALEYDPTFAQAYEGLANVYWHKHYGDVLSENYLDSMLILLNIALSYDDQLASAYVKRGDYYRVNNDKEQAIKEYDKALKINPNDWVVYLNSISMYDDVAIKIEYLLKAALLHRGYYLSRLYRGIAIHLSAFNKEKSHYYLDEALKLDNDSADHFRSLALIADRSGNLEKAVEFGEESYAFDSTDYGIMYLLGVNYCFLGHKEKSLEYFKKYEVLKTLKKADPRNVDIRDEFRIGYTYKVNGFNEEAEYHINDGLKLYKELLALNRISHQDYRTIYGYAAVHAFLGEREKAYEYLSLFNQKQRMPIRMIKDINYDPMFDSLRVDPKFLQIVHNMEAKYKAEHERVRNWLEKNDLI